MRNKFICTAQCYIKKDGKTLLLQRYKKENDQHEGKWLGIGGHLELGETSDEAMIREMKEETGLIPLELNFKGIITFPNFNGKGEDEIVYFYTCDKFEGQLIDCNEGRLEWIDDEKVKDLNLWEGDRIYFQWMKENRFFVGKIVYEKEKVVDYTVKFY